MLNLYILPRIEGVGDSLLLQLLTSKDQYVGGLFQQLPTAPFQAIASIVSNPADAQYFMLPHNWGNVVGQKAYLENIERIANQHSKRILVFAYGDSTKPVTIRNALVLRSSQYRSRLAGNEIIIPPFVEDLGTQYGVELRKHEGGQPTVGFTGWVMFPRYIQEIKYQVKIAIQWVRIRMGLDSPASLQGLYYRRRTLRVLGQNPGIHTDFIMRSSYSGNKRTIRGDTAEVRRQFVDSIKRSDFALAIRGDGNWSLRLYEILSLGRVPLYVDTDAPLPWEDEIEYDTFMLRVDYTKVDELAQIAVDRWLDLSDEEYRAMQLRAREVFETKLRADVFYRDLFARLARES